MDWQTIILTLTHGIKTSIFNQWKYQRRKYPIQVKKQMNPSSLYRTLMSNISWSSELTRRRKRNLQRQWSLKWSFRMMKSPFLTSWCKQFGIRKGNSRNNLKLKWKKVKGLIRPSLQTFLKQSTWPTLLKEFLTCSKL